MCAAYKSRRREEAGNPSNGRAYQPASKPWPANAGARAEASSLILWPCLCGAWNRLRDTTCRSCGDYKPEAHK
jgi:hypothetical protein